jgi:thiol-disulfide isomerase/thioredoxin
MKIKILLFTFLVCHTATSYSQKKSSPTGQKIEKTDLNVKPYEIRFNIKGARDTAMYLAIYTFDKQYLIDTAARAKDGSYTFKKKRNLDKGMYMLISQGKAKYLDFIINEDDKFTCSFDSMDVIKSMKFNGSPENEKFMELVKFMATKTMEFNNFKFSMKPSSAADSNRILIEKTKSINKEVDAFRKDFLNRYPAGFVSDFVRLQMEPDVSNPPKASNGRPDSVWQYQYFKNNYWKDVPLGDERILHTPIFGDKMKNYFQKSILQIPDSINVEIAKVVDRCKPSPEMFKWVLYWLTNWSETNKVMGFDAVFVFLGERYYKTGQVDFYTPDQLKKIIERVNILGPLLIGKKCPELLAVDTIGAKICIKLGLDSCKTSECLTDKYTKNRTEIDERLISLYGQKAKFKVLLFWDVDCGHCKKEVPVIFEKFQELRKEGIDVKVHAVYTQHEYIKWFKTLKEMKLSDPNWKNVVDGVHLQNLKEKFDIFSTPVIYILDESNTIKFKRIGAEQLTDVIHILDDPSGKKYKPSKKTESPKEKD